MLLLIFMLTVANISYAANNNFQFQISDYHTKRQGGQTIDVNVRYAIKDDVDYLKYPDYIKVREIVLTYLEPNQKFPVNTYWEILAANIGNDLLAQYPIFAGVSIQMIVYPNEKGAIPEPGFHGPIYTKGDVIPFSQVIIPKA